MKLPDHFFVSSYDGALHDTRVHDWAARPLRADYRNTHADIHTTQHLRATLRAGAYAWPGGYPLYFIANDGEPLSFESVRENYAQCARAIRTPGYGVSGWRIVGCAVNWEDNTLRCAHSGELIESAYGVTS